MRLDPKLYSDRDYVLHVFKNISIIMCASMSNDGAVTHFDPKGTHSSELPPNQQESIGQIYHSSKGSG